jgi:hypothetical protein
VGGSVNVNLLHENSLSKKIYYAAGGVPGVLKYHRAIVAQIPSPGAARTTKRKTVIAAEVAMTVSSLSAETGL